MLSATNEHAVMLTYYKHNINYVEERKVNTNVFKKKGKS